jgi:hypothetical protein
MSTCQFFQQLSIYCFTFLVPMSSGKKLSRGQSRTTPEFASTLHVWKWSTVSATWGRALSWQETHLTWLPPLIAFKTHYSLSPKQSKFIFYETNIMYLNTARDRLCGLLVRVCGYRPIGPGFDSRHFQIFWEAAVWNGVHSASWGQLRSYLKEKQRLRSIRPRLTTVGISCADHATPSIGKGRH